MDEATYSLCPRCYRAVPRRAGERFCISCGEALVQHCAHCQAAIRSPYARFCDSCGKPLTPATLRRLSMPRRGLAQEPEGL